MLARDAQESTTHDVAARTLAGHARAEFTTHANIMLFPGPMFGSISRPKNRAKTNAIRMVLYSLALVLFMHGEVK